LSSVGTADGGSGRLLAQHWTAEHSELLEEVNRLQGGVQHIKDIVTRQQSLSGISGMLEEVHLPRLIDEALAIYADALRKSRVDVRRDFEKMPPAICDRAKLTQTLVNLIANAEESLAQAAATERHLTLHTKTNGEGQC
jgi:two-component system sensor kinase FixL